MNDSRSVCYWAYFLLKAFRSVSQLVWCRWCSGRASTAPLLGSWTTNSSSSTAISPNPGVTWGRGTMWEERTGRTQPGHKQQHQHVSLHQEKLKLPPHGCTPPKTSQVIVTVYIHVCQPFLRMGRTTWKHNVSGHRCRQHVGGIIKTVRLTRRAQCQSFAKLPTCDPTMYPRPLTGRKDIDKKVRWNS